MCGGFGLGVASWGDREAIMGKCLDSKGSEVTELKLTIRFFRDRGEIKSSSLEY